MRYAGFTLIETVIFIIVLSIALTPLSIMLVNIAQQNIYSQAYSTAIALAEGEMERILNIPFSSISSETQTAFTSPFGVYRRQAIVDYVNPTDLNTAVAGPTSYKRIRLLVDSSTNILSGRTIELMSLATNTR
jgi:Tfp pilus assembly protein PilV